MIPWWHKWVILNNPLKVSLVPRNQSSFYVLTCPAPAFSCSIKFEVSETNFIAALCLRRRGNSWAYLKILPTTSISTSKREEVQGNVFVSHKFLTRKRRRPYSCLTPWCAAREDFLVIQTFQDRHSWGLQQGLEPPLFSGKKNQTFWKDNTWTISTVAKNTWVIIQFFFIFQPLRWSCEQLSETGQPAGWKININLY